MKLELALKVAKCNLSDHPAACKDPEIIMFKAKNGQYMTGRVGADYLEGRPTWTWAEFVKEFGHE